MKSLRRWIRALFGFSANETNGFLILIPLMFLLVLSEPVYRWWLVSEERNYSARDELLDSALAHWQNENRPATTVAKRFPFDPNTAAEAELLELGLDAVSARRIVAYRRKGGVFRTKSDLSKIYGLDSALYKQLYPYITLPVSTRDVFTSGMAERKQRKSWPQKKKFDINTADTVVLKTVYGIGPKLSARIVKFRSALGGFLRSSQLYEVYGLDSVVVERLLQSSFIDTDFQPEKLNINRAAEHELSRHPYIQRNLARRIVSYRFQHGDFHDANDIKKLWTLHDEDVERLLPYLTVE